MSMYVTSRVADAYLATRCIPLTITGSAMLIFLAGCFGGSYDTTPWDVVANCSSNGVSNSAITGIDNPYYNGYRLTTDTYSYDTSRGTSRFVHDYVLSDSSQSIVRRRRNQSSSVVSKHTQNYDNNGYFIGGSDYVNGGLLGSFYAYGFSYGDDGRILSYDKNQSTAALFVYSDDRLSAIKFYNADGVIQDTITYKYDEQFHLVSAFDSSIDLEYIFSCNSLNQIADVYTNRLYSDTEIMRDSRYEIEYDEHGNLIMAARYSSNGNLAVTYTYAYTKTDELIFNHWLMRLATGFVWKAANLIE